MKKIVVGISGASGFPLAIHLLEELKNNNCEVHLVMSTGAILTLDSECEKSYDDLLKLADYVYDNKNVGSSIASGTFKVDGMIVIPCSMKTVAGIRSGYSDTLLLRACDVMIKEKRKLILVTRETPLSQIHLENMLHLSKIQDVYIIPPMLTYYNKPKTIYDMETHIIGKILSIFDIEIANFKRWK